MILEALKMSFFMFWEVLWPLILGFFLSGVVQALVSHRAMSKNLGDDSVKSVTLASLFGIASSSCSYAAIALSRSIFQKGATLTNAMIFEIASTNLVIELGIILLVVLGWQFALAEWFGGIIMVIVIAFIFRFTLSKNFIREAKTQSEKGLQGRMEGHATMDMSIAGNKSFFSKLFSNDGFTSVSHFFVMDWLSIWTDLVIGFLVAGALAIYVPSSFWQTFFFAHNRTLGFIVGPLVGPLIAVISFVCSIGNVPLAAVLWKGGISFGGVVSFIFADLIVLPILDIYRKYYGSRIAAYIFVTFYLGMAVAGYIVEFLFSAFRILPVDRNAILLQSGVTWNYTTILNIVFLIFAFILIFRFFKTGGAKMLKMMDSSLMESTHHR